MPTEVTGPVYTKNAVRITFQTKNWSDLETDPDELTVSVRKVQNESLVAIADMQDIAVTQDGPLTRVGTGVFEFRLNRGTMTPGTYYAEFEGSIDGDLIYEPVEVIFQTLEQAVRGQ